MKETAGIAVIYQDKILLVHPTNSKWMGSYSIPKGHIEKSESKKEAAKREFYEETGIKIKLKLGKPIELKYITIKKVLWFYVLHIDSLDEIGLKTEVVPKNQLQLSEVDWCGFVSKKEAIKRINRNMLEIIKYV